MNRDKPLYEWKNLPWKRIEKEVFKLQKRIYQASSREDIKSIHKLQRLLLNSFWAKCLAIRRVTQDNQGKKTAGVDGEKCLKPAQRMALIPKLNMRMKAKPLRRVWIPKKGTLDKRPLGIPTIQDRCLQALVKLALEPEWEAKFEANSYGFRPGRSCHDAIESIFNMICHKPRYVLDADIEKCFEGINHEALLNKLQAPPKWSRVIKEWLKAGVMEGDKLYPTESGTPQGGVISPLLANIALHGLEEDLSKEFPRYKRINGRSLKWGIKVVRYADDLVILHQSLEVIEKAKEWIEKWLNRLGLGLKESKTQISHTLEAHQGKVGFNFLGFEIRQYPVGKSHIGRYIGHKLGFKTLIKPSKEAMKTQVRNLKRIVRQYQTATQDNLINRLNPVIRGWSAYYSTVVSKQVFSKLDSVVYSQLRRWGQRRHSNKSRKWVSRKYWRHHTGKWDFSSQERRLRQHGETGIQRHVKVKGNKTPFDGDWPYWSKRLSHYAGIPRRIGKLLKKQNGKCTGCGLYLKKEDAIELDHITPKNAGGKNEYVNWQLLHRHCHDHKSVIDGSATTRIKRCS